MRAPLLLILCAALSALSARTHADDSPHQHLYQHIRTQILSKLGLSSRPMALHAPPRDVVRQILQRAAGAPTPQHDQTSHREIIVIAHRDFLIFNCFVSNMESKIESLSSKQLRGGVKEHERSLMIDKKRYESKKTEKGSEIFQ